MSFYNKLAKFLATSCAVLLLMYGLILYAEAHSSTYISFAPPSIAILYKMLTTSGMRASGDLGVFVLTCALILLVGAAYFRFCVTLAKLTNAVFESATNSFGVTTVAAISEVATPIAVVTAIYNLATVFFELEDGIDIAPWFSRVQGRTPIPADDEVQNTA